jgi:hypothetical protein
MIRRLYLVSHSVAVAMSGAAVLLTGIVTLFEAVAASVRAAFRTTRASAAIPLTRFEPFEAVRIRTASFEPARLLCFMEFS